MTRRSRPHLLRSRDPHDEHGQVIVLFALVLIVLIAMAGLLIDGGLAWGNRRQAQGAADTAALAAATTITSGGKLTDVRSAAQSVAAANGYGVTNSTDCSGSPLPGNAGNGIQVNNPPASPDPHAGDTNYVEVIVTRAMHTTFSSAVGQSCWLVSARAVAVAASSRVASCNFCSTNNASGNHTLLLQNGAKLRVDGDIYVNSTSGCGTLTTGANGLKSCNTTACTLKSWNVCGDAFDVFGTPDVPPAYISAKSIAVVGGWETHDQNIVTADSPHPPTLYTDPLGPACPYYQAPQYQPPSQTQLSNVCIHMPAIVDPFATVPTPTTAGLTVPTAGPPASCAPINTAPVKGATGTQATPKLTNIITGIWTICPGIYYGGISISGTGTTVYMRSGIYYISDSINATGFAVTAGASVDGSAGVMIYNSGTKGAVNIQQLSEGVNIQPDPDLTAENPSFPGFPGSPLPSVSLTKGTTRTVPTTPTYAFKVNQVGASKLSGEVHFFDGLTELSSGTSGNCPVVTKVNSGNFTANCKVSWTTADVGTHGLAAVFYSSASTYDNIEMIQSPREILKVAGVVGGTTLLNPMPSGTYKGFVIFQGGGDPLNMVISPQSPLADCSGTMMTDGIPDTAPPPCGDLGGISGTIYIQPPSGNLALATAQVQITASGLADLQVVAGKILITNGADARFAFTPNKFALGSIRLVE